MRPFARGGGLLLMLGCALATAGCTMRGVEHRFIFFPSRELIGSPRDLGLEYTSVHVTTSDGVRLHGWWIPAARERAVVLFFHGNAGNISDRLESIRIFHELGLSVFIFDYRGYGQSQGAPSEQGTYDDAETAWRYLLEQRRVERDRIVMFGRSLGAAVAVESATRHAPKALIVESSFTSIRAMARTAVPWAPIGPFLTTRYDTLSKIPRVGCPLLVVHSRDDEVIPYAQGRALYDAARDPKQFLDLRYGHNEGFLLSAEAYVAGLDAFLTRFVAPRPPSKGKKAGQERPLKPEPAKPEPSPFSREAEPARPDEEFMD
jgi:hypothetical protein